MNEQRPEHRTQRFRNVWLVGTVAMVLVGIAVGVAQLVSTGDSVRIDGTSVACREVVVIGARESGSELGTRRNFGLTGADALAALTSQLKSRRSVSSLGLNYPALSMSAIVKDSNEYFDGVEQGVENLLNITKHISDSCRSWIVLIGYSQGALVIRKALLGMTQSTRSQIAAVTLFGDPARSLRDGTMRFGGSEASIAGLYESVIGTTRPVPSLRGPVASWCNRGDAICAAQTDELLGMALQAGIVGGSSTPHGQYRFDGSTEAAGVLLADQLLKLPKRPPLR